MDYPAQKVLIVENKPVRQEESQGVEAPLLPLRIAMVSYSLPVLGEKRGGIEQVAHDLANGLAERGHEVTVWTHDPKPEGAHYSVRSLPWKNFVSTWFGRRFTMGYAGNLLSALPRYRDADILVAHGDSILLPLLGRPVVRVMHGSALGEAMSAKTVLRFVTQAGVYLQELVTPLSQVCVGVSENARRFNPLVRHVIPIGTDLRQFRPADGERSEHPTILFVGTLAGRKRGALLIDWFREKIRPRFPDAELHMVGPSGTAEDGVSFHTGVSREALAAMYRRAWVYASPSSYEGFGLPYVEAMASGTPVIATPNPGSREVLDNGRFGVVVEDEEFPDELANLLSDTARRERLRQVGLERARQYSTDAMVTRYEAMFEQLCRAKRFEAGAN